MENPLSIEPLFHIGPVPVTGPVVVTWGLMILLAGGSALLTRNLKQNPVPLGTRKVVRGVEKVVEKKRKEKAKTAEKKPRAAAGEYFKLNRVQVHLSGAQPRKAAPKDPLSPLARVSSEAKKPHLAVKLDRTNRARGPHGRPRPRRTFAGRVRGTPFHRPDELPRARRPPPRRSGARCESEKKTGRRRAPRSPCRGMPRGARRWGSRAVNRPVRATFPPP